MLINFSNIESIITSIEKNNPKNSIYIIHNFLYFIYRFIECNDYYPDLQPNEGGVPNGGI